MKNLNSKILKTLENVGVPVSFIKRDKKAPIEITFFTINGTPDNFNDNNYECIEHLIQVDIWAKYGNSITDITRKVIKAMQDNNFYLSSVRADMYESDTDMIHKPIEFRYIENKSEMEVI